MKIIVKSVIRKILRDPNKAWMIAPDPATITSPFLSASNPIGIERMINARGCEAVKSTTPASPGGSPSTGVTSFLIKENASHIICPIMKIRPNTSSTAQRYL